MELRLTKLKGDFNNIITVRNNVKNVFDILQVRIDKLRQIYSEFIESNKNEMFVFGLDSFHFQSKLIDIEYDDMKRRMNQQQRTVDVVNGVKDKLLTVQDELATSVNAFSRQISGLKNMINVERRKQAETQTKSYEWIGLLLNVILTIAIVFAVISLIRVFINRSRGQTSMPYPSRYIR
jgi:hypothetical protein